MKMWRCSVPFKVMLSITLLGQITVDSAHQAAFQNSIVTTTTPTAKTSLFTAKQRSTIPTAFSGRSIRSTSTLLLSKLSAYETVLEFNAQFKQGLKYVLVPQLPPTGTRPSNYYDGAIPDTLEAPIVQSNMDYTSVSDNMVSTAAKLTTESYMNLPTLNFEVPNVSIKLSDGIGQDIQNVIDQVTQTKLVVSTDKLDAMGRDVNVVLQAAKTVLASSFEIASNSPFVEVAAVANTKMIDAATVANKKLVDPVVDRTMLQIKYAITHPPDFAGYTFEGGAPPGQGLATPLLDYVTRSLQAAREEPPLFFADPLPDAYGTVQYGFQIKNTAIETAQQIQSSVYESAQQIAANNEIVKEGIRKVVLSELEQIQARNVLIAEKVSAQSQLNVEYLHDSQLAFSNRVVENAKLLQNQLHMSDWTHRGEEQLAILHQNLISALRNNDFYQSDQIKRVITSLKVEELGGWYTGAIAGLLVLLLAQKDKQAAIEAATSQITMATQKQIEQANMEKQRFEGMVIDLTQAVAILTEELRMLKTQRMQTDNVLASVQNDVKYVMNQKLTETLAQNEVLRNQLESSKLEVQTLKEGNVRTRSLQ
jgi:hypothetical protein